MFRDAKEELARLEAELLAADRADEEAANDALLEEFLNEEDDYPDGDMDFGYGIPDDSRGMVYRNYSNNYGRGNPSRPVHNSDRTDEDLDVYSDWVYQEEKDNVRGLLITAMMLLGGIVAVLLFWVFRYFKV